MTAATTRIVRGTTIPGRSVIDAEQLLTHQQDVGRAHQLLGADAHERAVRATDVRQIDLAVRTFGDAAVQARDVAVFAEQNVAALTAAMHAAFRDRERVACGVATDDQRQATDVTLGRAAEAIHAVGRATLTLELFESDDLLPDAEQITELEQAGLVRTKLEIHAVQRVFVFDRQLRAAARERRVTR